MKKAFFSILTMAIVTTIYANVNSKEKLDGADLSIIDVSQQLLLAAKTKKPTDSFVSLIKAITSSQLKAQLNNDDAKKAFWINLYNAFTQINLSKNPENYNDRSSFFSDKQIEIAGQKLSLDNIEHGILRRSKIKWSLGHFNKLFPSSFEKETRVDALDYRVHFALNCGAKSCPPIAFYQPDQIDKQLDIATKAYLKGDAEYDAAKSIVLLPAIMGWFRADFGGKKKMVELLKELQVIPANKNPSVKFSKYDWNLFLENYKS